MAKDDPLFPHQTFTPGFKGDKFNLTKYLEKNCKDPGLAASAVGFVLLRLLASEQAGNNPHAEGALREILNMKGLNNNVLYGSEIPQDIRQLWQRAGKDTDSEDEVIGYLKSINVTVLSQYDKSPSAAELKAFADKNNFIPTPPPSAPSPKNR